MRSFFARSGGFALLSCIIASAAPVSAQTTPNKDPWKEGDKKPDEKKDDEGVVFDNRHLSEEQKEKKKQENAELFENDTPFADTTPPPASESREEKWKPGFVFGGRVGYANGRGKYRKVTPFSETNDGEIFVWGDAGYAPIPYLSFGLYLIGGYVLSDGCPEGVTCAGWDVRGGVEVLSRLLPFQQFSPLIGLGFGYEWLTQSASTSEFSSRTSVHGLELANIQLGLDVRREDEIYGVFLSYSLGRFTKYSTKSDLGNDSGSIDGPGTHNWIGVGLRGSVE